MRSLALFCIVLIVASSGCGVSLFVKPEEQAVVDEQIFPDWLSLFGKQDVRAASTKLERRIVVFSRTWEDNKWKLKVCTEPPAEAMQALNSVNKLEATLAQKYGKDMSDTLSGKGDFGLTTAVQAAFRRTQGLQFYRDGAYQWCQAYLNGLVTKENFLKKLDALEKNATALIKEEIKQPGFYVGTFPQIQVEQLKQLHQALQ